MQRKQRKARSRGKIYFCNRDSSPLETVSTEPVNHQTRFTEGAQAGLAEDRPLAQALGDGAGTGAPGSGEEALD